MLQNNLKIGMRSLIRGKVNSVINVGGLALGMAVCLVIWRYVEFELSYDSFNKNSKNIFRITSSIYSNGEQWSFAGYDLGPSLEASIPEINAYSRKHSVYGGTIVSLQSATGEQKSFRERRFQFVDSAFLDIFSFDVILGDGSTALDKSSSIVISESLASKYFGTDNPLGKMVKVSGYGNGEFQVTAVIKDVPPNSHFMFDALLSMRNLLQSDDYRGGNERLDNFVTYVELEPGVNLNLLHQKMQIFLMSYLFDTKDRQAQPTIRLQSLLDIHLEDHFADDIVQRPGVSKSELITFFFISVLVMTIAWINYINLSTARAAERGREVGIRKVIGVSRLQLIGQFFTESVMVNALALVLAIGISFFFIPVVSGIIGKPFHFDFTSATFWIATLVLLSVGILFSGIYPSIVLSSGNVIDAIKGTHSSGKNSTPLRQGLVIMQFAGSFFLLAASMTAFLQMKFMENNNRGYDSDQMLIVEGPSVFELKGIEERIISFKNEVQKIPSVMKACTSDAVPGQGYNWATHMEKKGALRNEILEGQNIDIVFVDVDFPDTYGFKLKSGENWKVFMEATRSSLLINEASIKPFHLGDQTKALNETLVVDQYDLQVSGVLENYNWYSLKSKFTPMVFWPQRICSQKFSIKVGGDISNTVGQVETIYKAYFEGNPFDYYFLDENFNRLYKDDQAFGKLVSLLSVIAMAISCLGLFALASFTIMRKTKEIGIRKVLGASVKSVVSLLSWQFMKPVALSFAISAPVARYLIDEWLSSFAFRISFPYEIFFLSFLLLALLAMVTISLQTIRAAATNPVNSLRSD